MGFDRLMLQNIFQWLAMHPDKLQSPWLMLGKGPSFSKKEKYDIHAYEILTLNDAIRETPKASIAHFIDIEAFERNANYVLRNAKFVVMPWYPHVNNALGKRTLQEYIHGNEVLRQLANEERLLYYELNKKMRDTHSLHPSVTAIFFSAEAAFSILASAGVKKIRSLGIDGGDSYSIEFSDLENDTCLSNGQKDFNSQFKSFAEIIFKTKVDYSPLDSDSPVRVFVASTASEALPVKVLEYSIKKNASVSVRVSPIMEAGLPIPSPRNPDNKPRTPFSFQRFLIPELTGYEGKAIYLDSDMLVFKDIRNLWSRPFVNADVLAAYTETHIGRKPQYSVMLLDCNKLDWNIYDIVAKLDSGALTYEQLMYDFELANVSSCIEPEWNALETYNSEKTALLHFTDMHTQPWVSTQNPLGYLWVKMLRAAIDDGFISREFLATELQKGHVRPSLLYQVEQGLDDPLLLPKEVLKQDDVFSAPYFALGAHNGNPWKSRILWLKSLLRLYYQRSSLYRFERKVRRKFF